MKTIAVLTDFSERSIHAARYATHLAQAMGADILLFNAFNIPDFSSSAIQVSWPADDYHQIKEDSERKLDELSARLEKELKGKSLPGIYIPEINYQCEEGEIANNISELEDSANVVLLVLGVHGVDDKSAFMMGNHCHEVIDTASVPILIVPENASIRNIEKFVFATDNTRSDIFYINSLSGLAKYFSAQILVANIRENRPISHEEEDAINLFKQEIVKRVKYSEVHYRSFPNKNIESGLIGLIENIQFDVLVMVHRKGSFYDNFYKKSFTKQLADKTYVPMLVYPYPVESLPNF